MLVIIDVLGEENEEIGATVSSTPAIKKEFFDKKPILQLQQVEIYQETSSNVATILSTAFVTAG